MMFRRENDFQETLIGMFPKEWTVGKLGDVSIKIIGGGTPSTSKPEYWDGDIPWMTSANLTTRVVRDGMRNITRKGLEDSASNIVPKGSLIVATRVGIGKVGIAGIDIAISQDSTGVTVDSQRVDVEYLYWVFIGLASYLKTLAQGSTIKGLLREYLRDLTIPMPPLEEQRNIGKVLATVDEAIHRTDGIAGNTERLKKGLMQELLTRGIGHKEFKDTEIGRIPKNWQVVRVRDVAETSTGGTPDTRKKEYYGGNIPWVKSGELKDNTIYTTDQKITESGLQNSNARFFPKWTLLVALYGATVGKTGILGIEATTNQAICAILPNKDIGLDPTYLKYYFALRRSQLITMSSGGAQPNISQGIIRDFRFALPPIKEQQRMVEIISTLDRKAELERKQKENLDRIKEGFMDLLLTGRVRVRVD